jgi:hypothetical protein
VLDICISFALLNLSTLYQRHFSTLRYITLFPAAIHSTPYFFPPAASQSVTNFLSHTHAPKLLKIAAVVNRNRFVKALIVVVFPLLLIMVVMTDKNNKNINFLGQFKLPKYRVLSAAVTQDNVWILS